MVTSSPCTVCQNSAWAMTCPASERVTIVRWTGPWICRTEICSAGEAMLNIVAKREATNKLLRAIQYLVLTFNLIDAERPPARTAGRSHLIFRRRLCLKGMLLRAGKRNKGVRQR